MPEILAPAGNFEMLKAAVVNGADAVYLGLSRFSARAKAANFDGEELKKAIDYAHLFGTKVYVAINTVIKDEEMSDALLEAENALRLGADALIVQDLGLAQKLRSLFPDAVLHASTQMGIHNLYGAIATKRLGFSRIILSRETLLSDIVDIKKNVDIEVECFVQGALCISFSGNCYFSSLASGYSGNRGKCMQLCRKEYSTSLNGKERKGYLLSAKDICLLDKIPLLIKAGVDCFKIEGRLRRPEYVAESVRIYKNAVMSVTDIGDEAALKKVYNRGDYTDGHLIDGTNTVLETKLNGHKGLFYGKVTSVMRGKIKLNKPLYKGDGIKILRDGYEVGSASVNSDGNETTYVGSASVGDDVYITTDARLNRSIMERNRKLPVKVDIDFDRSSALLKSNNIEVSAAIQSLPALNAPLTKDGLIDCFNKSEHFYVQQLDVRGRASFIAKSKLNELRRSLYQKLEDEILAVYRANMQKFDKTYQVMSDIISNNLDFLHGETIYQVSSPKQITDEMKWIAVNPTEYSVSEILKFEPYFDRALLNMPFVARGKDIDILKQLVELPLRGFIANNLYAVEMLKDKPVLLGYGMNLVNDVILCPKIYSFEADRVNENGYVYCKGNVPLMTFCHCERKELSGSCSGCNGYDIALNYERREFKIRRYKIHYCYSQLLNCADLDIGKDVKCKFIDLSYDRTGKSTKGNYGRGLK